MFLTFFATMDALGKIFELEFYGYIIVAAVAAFYGLCWLIVKLGRKVEKFAKDL